MPFPVSRDLGKALNLETVSDKTFEVHTDTCQSLILVGSVYTDDFEGVESRRDECHRLCAAMCRVAFQERGVYKWMLGYNVVRLFAYRQCPNAIRTEYLVKADTCHIQSSLFKWNLILAEGLHAVRVKEERQAASSFNASQPFANGHELFPVVCSGFVVYCHYAYQDSVCLNGCKDISSKDYTCYLWLYQCNRYALLIWRVLVREVLKTTQNRFVLVLTGNDVKLLRQVARLTGQELYNRLDRQTIGFCAGPCEYGLYGGWAIC